MFSYEFYKVIHLSSIFLFIVTLVALAHGPNEKLKSMKILQGITTLFIFVAGMGLLARIGIKHAEPWPLWVMAKTIIWLVVAISTPVLLKRVHGTLRTKLVWAILTCIILATLFAIFKWTL